LVLGTFDDETHNWVPTVGLEAFITTRCTFWSSSLQLWAVWKSLALGLGGAKGVDKLG